MHKIHNATRRALRPSLQQREALGRTIKWTVDINTKSDNESHDVHGHILSNGKTICCSTDFCIRGRKVRRARLYNSGATAQLKFEGGPGRWRWKYRCAKAPAAPRKKDPQAPASLPSSSSLLLRLYTLSRRME